MAEHDLLQSVEQARRQIVALRIQLQTAGPAPVSEAVGSALGDLQEMLDALPTRCSLLREILARTNDVVFAKDRAGRYVMINRNGAVLFGQSVEQIVGQDDTTLYDSESARRIMAIDREVMDTGKSRTFEANFEIRGRALTLLTTESAWYEPEGILRGLIGTAQDVTARKQAERGAEARQERLSALASEIVINEERLRQSLAADLHTGLGQDIALTRMKLAGLRDSVGAELRESLSHIEGLVEQADRSLRSITYQLSPPSLHDLGLLPALEWLSEDMASRFGLHVRIEDEGTPAIADGGMRLILFRAVRELLTHAATHAGARAARVRIGAEGEGLRVVVADEGTGFDSTRVESSGNGLFGIGEPLRHVGGRMHIDSRPGRGTTVTLSTPLALGAPVA
jgi:PAS domain S-box-containing protein